MVNKSIAKTLANQIKEEIGISTFSLERVAEIICKGLDMKDQQLKSRCVNESHLIDWFIASIDETVKPVWTEEHINELCKDFYVIPKED